MSNCTFAWVIVVMVSPRALLRLNLLVFLRLVGLERSEMCPPAARCRVERLAMIEDKENRRDRLSLAIDDSMSGDEDACGGAVRVLDRAGDAGPSEPAGLTAPAVLGSSPPQKRSCFGDGKGSCGVANWLRSGEETCAEVFSRSGNDGSGGRGITVVRTESILDLVRADDSENLRALFMVPLSDLLSPSTACGKV